MVIMFTASFVDKISTFCPHSVFMCFVWIWEQTAIISLYSIDWLVFITEKECVYCAVRTGSLYIILRSTHKVYLCVLCRSENKQRLFPYTALNDWFSRLVFLKLRNSSVSFISSVFLHSQAQPSVHMLKLSSRLKGFHEICVLLGNLSKTPILIKHWQEYRTFEKKTKLFLKREMFQTKVVGKTEIHILWFTTFSPTKIVPFVGCV